MSETPRCGHAPIEMRYRPKPDSLEAFGDFRWDIGESGKRTLVVMIPAGRSDRSCYSRWTIDHKNHCDAQWSWDGNEDKPTLAPSLHAVGVWHGHVRAGMLVEA